LNRVLGLDKDHLLLWGNVGQSTSGILSRGPEITVSGDPGPNRSRLRFATSIPSCTNLRKSDLYDDS